MYKVGIIGFGKMGMLHGALLNGTGKAKITAICDKSLAMRVGFKRVYKHVHTYDDFEKMLAKEELDIIVVTTPTFNHENAVICSLEKECSVFVEKPLSINAKQCLNICQTAEKCGRVAQVGFCNRFLPSVKRAKEILDHGTLGPVTGVHGVMFIADVLEEHTGWRYKPELSGGGVLMDFGIHMIDLLIHLFGEVSTVRGETRRLYSARVEDEAGADIEFLSGVQCRFETSWSKEAYRKSYTRVEVVASNGRMILTDQTLEIFDVSEERVEYYTYPDLYGGSYLDIGGILYSRQMEEFLELVERNNAEKERDGCTLRQAFYVQQVVEAIYQSAEERVKIKVGGEE